MSQIPTKYPNCTKLHVGEQGAHFAEVGAQPQCSKNQLNLLKGKNICNITIFNIRISKTINQLPELVESAA